MAAVVAGGGGGGRARIVVPQQHFWRRRPFRTNTLSSLSSLKMISSPGGAGCAGCAGGRGDDDDDGDAPKSKIDDYGNDSDHDSVAETTINPTTTTVKQQQEHQQQQQHNHHRVERHDPGTSTIQLNGIPFVPVTIYGLPRIGSVTVLEATAEAQGVLVDCALSEDDDDDDDNHNNNSKQLLLNNGDPYGAVLWPAAVAVARYLLENATELLTPSNNKYRFASIVEVGTGTGLVSLVAALGGAHIVMATDYEQLPLDMCHYAGQHLNPISKTQQSPLPPPLPIQTQLFDLCNMDQSLPITIQSSSDKTATQQHDDASVGVLVAADIMYEPRTGIAMAHRAVQALQMGFHVVIGDSPGRSGQPAFLGVLRNELNDPDLDFVMVQSWTVTGPRHELICGAGSTSHSSKRPSQNDHVSEPQPLQIGLMHLRPDLYRFSIQK